MMRGLNKVQGNAVYFTSDALGEYAIEIKKCFKKCVGKDTQLHDKPESFIVEALILGRDNEESVRDVGDVVTIMKKPFGAQATFAFREMKEFLTAAFATQDQVTPNQVDFDDDRAEEVITKNSLEGVKLLVNVELANNPQYTKLTFKPGRG